ncbi:MAG: hypothetical protein LBH29_06175, partial [Elusimicrobiota bacterium]|nr:hypothetical protein [Elusimicrobiota bacterium]
MKTYCLKNELIKGINAVMPITQTRNALPILANLLFKTEENAIVISATDLERAIICKIKGEIIEEGAITISAKKFLKIIMEFPSDKPIEISSDKSSQININIKSEKIKTKLTGIDASEYPAIPAFPTENSISINKNTLISMLKKTVFSVSKDP